MRVYWAITLVMAGLSKPATATAFLLAQTAPVSTLPAEAAPVVEVPNVAPATTSGQLLQDFLELNLVIGACESHVSPFLLRTVDDYARAAGPRVQEMVEEYRYAGRNELRFTARDCAVFLQRAIAKARLPGG